MRFSYLIALTFVSACSSTSSHPIPATAPGPVAPIAMTDAAIAVSGNRSVERSVFADFVVGGTYAAYFDCTFEMIGGCQAATCTSATKTPGALDPGKLTASSPSLGTDVEVVLKGGTGDLVQPGSFADRETVKLRTTGAQIPALDESVTLPPTATAFTLDGCNSSSEATPCSFSSNGSVLAWTGASGAWVAISVTSTLDTSPSTSVRCNFDGTPGKGRVPPEAIAKIGSGKTVSLRASIRTVPRVVNAGKYTVLIEADHILAASMTARTP